MVEDSDDGASWTEINRGENNSDLSSNWAVKTFAVTRPGSFRRIRLRQTGPNHKGSNCLVLSLFGVFGAVTELLQTVQGNLFFAISRRTALAGSEHKRSTARARPART
jgi:hypothetical protein